MITGWQQNCLNIIRLTAIQMFFYLIILILLFFVPPFVPAGETKNSSSFLNPRTLWMSTNAAIQIYEATFVVSAGSIPMFSLWISAFPLLQSQKRLISQYLMAAFKTVDSPSYCWVESAGVQKGAGEVLSYEKKASFKVMHYAQAFTWLPCVHCRLRLVSLVVARDAYFRLPL